MKASTPNRLSASEVTTCRCRRRIPCRASFRCRTRRFVRRPINKGLRLFRRRLWAFFLLLASLRACPLWRPIRPIRTKVPAKWKLTNWKILTSKPRRTSLYHQLAWTSGRSRCRLCRHSCNRRLKTKTNPWIRLLVTGRPIETEPTPGTGGTTKIGKIAIIATESVTEMVAEAI
ncbi:unnamed protein product, partial [Nesidiocoris tenuis]